METLKSLARGLISAGLKVGLVSLALVMSVVTVLGNPGSIKQTLGASGVYEKVIDGALNEANQPPHNDQGGPQGTVPREQLVRAAKDAFTPDVLKNAAEQITDGIYAWLQGKTPEPNFRVDLTAEKQKFIETLADSAADRARQLPACSLGQLQELQNSTPDPWSLPCIPPGYSIANVRDRAVAEFASSNEFLPDPIITAEDFPKDSGGQSVFQTASDAPKIYGWILMAPWIIAILTLLAAGFLLLLHDDKRRALRTIGITLLGSGIFLFIISAVYNLAFKQGFQVDSSNDFQQPLLDAIHNLQNAISTKLLWFGAVYTILGLLSLLALHFNKRVEEIQTNTSLSSSPQPDTFNDSVLPPPAAEDQNKRDKSSF